MKQAEDSHAGGSSYKYLAIGDNGRDEFIVGEVVPASRSLIAVVEFVAKVRRVVGVEDAVAGLEFSTAHTIPFCVPLALTLGVVPG